MDQILKEGTGECRSDHEGLVHVDQILKEGTGEWIRS